MRALFAVATVLAVIALAGQVAADEVPAISGFDHRIHDRDIVVSGADSLPCTRCHTMRSGLVVGRPDHNSCFGQCHGAAPAKGVRGKKLAIEPERLELCLTCHLEAKLTAPFDRTVPATFPPYVATDFALAAGHQLHRDVTCTQCHPAAKSTPHRRCAGCHDGASTAGRGPAMTACTGCHTPGAGNPLPPRLAEPRNTVTASAFSHAKHAQRGGAGAQCVTCHAAIRETNDNALPRPKMASCGTSGCHDGKPTFAVTTACTKCHPTAPTDKFTVVRPPTRFSHATHEVWKLACASCHPLSKGGEVLVSGHAPCAACHADDFAAREPKTCGACHNATEPWRKLVADRPPPERTEFGATLDHSKHPGDCKACHSLRTASSQLRPPRGHRACTGAACHAVGHGPVPQLSACEGCHASGLAMTRTTARANTAWSVRERFEHKAHLRDGAGAELPCTSCHVDLTGASISTLATPAKKTCAPCHDGKAAFKLTGTTCMRCHPGVKP